MLFLVLSADGLMVFNTCYCLSINKLSIEYTGLTYALWLPRIFNTTYWSIYIDALGVRPVWLFR